MAEEYQLYLSPIRAHLHMRVIIDYLHLSKMLRND